MSEFYQRFCTEGFDENGVLNRFELHYPENYNFGYDVVDARAKETPNDKALVWCNVEGETAEFTFEQMSRLSNQAANLFTDYGIKKGDKVIVVLKRHYQYWYTLVALNKIGAVAIPATHLLTKKDFVYRFHAADAVAIVCTAEGEVSEHAEQAQPDCPTFATKFLVRGGDRDGWVNFDEKIKEYPDTFERRDTKATDPFLLYFTSGTTGYPKMVMHDHTYSLGHIITARHWHTEEPGELHLTVSETGWGKAAWGKLYGQWIVGSTIFVYDFDKFVAADLLHLIEKYKISTFCAPPTIFRFFIKEGIEGYDFSSVRYANIAGEALNPEVYNRFRDYAGLKLMEGFGQTETTLLLANLKGMEPKPGSMGKPSPMYNVDLVDEDGNSVAPGVVGEIVVHTEENKKQVGLFMGYYRDEEKTKAVWHDGLYHTGDTAWKDEDGYFWYVGRTDDVIKASGYRIGPFEIESVLMEHPSVLECAVTGAPDPVRGQVVKATIVLTKDHQPSEELKKELQNYVKKQTAPYKYPRIVEFVSELPKTISGKIRRAQIRQENFQKAGE